MKRILLSSAVALALVAGVSVSKAKADPLGIVTGEYTAGSTQVIAANAVAGVVVGSWLYALGDMVYTCASGKYDCSKAKVADLGAEHRAQLTHEYNVAMGYRDDVQTAAVISSMTSQ